MFLPNVSTLYQKDASVQTKDQGHTQEENNFSFNTYTKDNKGLYETKGSSLAATVICLCHRAI